MRRINTFHTQTNYTVLSLIIFLLIHALSIYTLHIQQVQKPFFLARIPPYRRPPVLTYICRKMVVEGQEDLY